MSLGMIVIVALAVLLILGIIFGLVLGFAAKVFAVEKDPREEAISECLPGANCGGCGYPGCAGYAAAVVAGKAAPNCCAVGGEEVSAKIAEIMGVKVETSVKMVAEVRCTGGCHGRDLYHYIGIQDCAAAARVPGGGPAGCSFGCLGFGSCEAVCPFDAIHVIDGVAKVDHEKCKACKKCIDVCPRHLIDLVPLKTRRHVAITCSSKDKGKDVRANCDNGCIGCGLCAKACPKDAITLKDNLASIDYSKCIGCGLCAQKCPRKLITVDGKVPAPRPVPPKKPVPPKPAAPAAGAAPAAPAAPGAALVKPAAPVAPKPAEAPAVKPAAPAAPVAPKPAEAPAVKPEAPAAPAAPKAEEK